MVSKTGRFSVKKQINRLGFWKAHKMDIALDPLVSDSVMCSTVGFSLCRCIFTVFAPKEHRIVENVLKFHLFSQAFHLFQHFFNEHLRRPNMSQGLHRVFTGSSQGLHRVFTGSSQGLHRVFTGSSQGLHRVFTGSSQGLHRVTTFQIQNDNAKGR